MKNYIHSFLFIHFYCFQMNSYTLWGSLDTKTNQKSQVYAYKSVNNGYSLNALEHSHMKCEHKSFLTLTTPN